jgi:hypothetical protein
VGNRRGRWLSSIPRRQTTDEDGMAKPEEPTALVRRDLVDAGRGREGLPTSLTVAIAASRAAILGAAVDLLGLLLLLAIGPNNGETESYVSLDSWHELGVPALVDALTIACALMTWRRTEQARRTGRNWALVTFGVNVSYRAVTGLAYWVGASDTGTGQPAPDNSRFWVLCGACVVLLAAVVIVGSLATPSALRFLDEAEAMRDTHAGEAPRQVRRRSPTRQIVLIVVVGILSVLGTGLALVILVSQ